MGQLSASLEGEAELSGVHKEFVCQCNVSPNSTTLLCHCLLPWKSVGHGGMMSQENSPLHLLSREQSFSLSPVFSSTRLSFHLSKMLQCQVGSSLSPFKKKN